MQDFDAGFLIVSGDLLTSLFALHGDVTEGDDAGIDVGEAARGPDARAWPFFLQSGYLRIPLAPG
jgi:hypothetical protein